MSLYSYDYKLQDHIITLSHRHSDLNDFGIPDIHSSDLNMLWEQFHTDDIKQQYIWFLAMVSNSLEQLRRLSAKTKML